VSMSAGMREANLGWLAEAGLEQQRHWLGEAYAALDAAVDEATRLARENEQLRDWFQGIIDLEPTEVCYDQFAYDRLVETYRRAARTALTEEPA
jgi:hypothetical protein